VNAGDGGSSDSTTLVTVAVGAALAVAIGVCVVFGFCWLKGSQAKHQRRMLDELTTARDQADTTNINVAFDSTSRPATHPRPCRRW